MVEEAIYLHPAVEEAVVCGMPHRHRGEIVKAYVTLAPGTEASDAAAVRSPMADLPSGAGFGSLVHAVLEEADPQATDLHEELRARAAEQLSRWPADLTADDLADALVPLHRTPLGPLAPEPASSASGRPSARDR